MTTLFRIVSRDGDRGRIDCTRQAIVRKDVADKLLAELTRAHKKTGRKHWVVPVIEGLSRAEEALFAALLIQSEGLFVHGADIAHARALEVASVARLKDLGSDKPEYMRWWAEAVKQEETRRAVG